MGPPVTSAPFRASFHGAGAVSPWALLPTDRHGRQHVRHSSTNVGTGGTHLISELGHEVEDEKGPTGSQQSFAASLAKRWNMTQVLKEALKSKRACSEFIKKLVARREGGGAQDGSVQGPTERQLLNATTLAGHIQNTKAKS